MEYISIIGLVAGLCTTASVIPQIVKSWKTKKTADVSPLMFAILLIGIILWIIYGILKNDFPIIATNGLALVLNSVMIFCMLKYRGNS